MDVELEVPGLSVFQVVMNGCAKPYENMHRFISSANVRIFVFVAWVSFEWFVLFIIIGYSCFLEFPLRLPIFLEV
jgi:hypothetical protein